MRAVIQRVSAASVTVGGRIVGEIGPGLLVLLGVRKGDSAGDVAHLVDKTVHLRIFPDQQGKMNRSLMDIAGSMLVVSQFTLYGDCKKGRRPSYNDAADPKQAKELYELFVAAVAKSGISCATGEFQAMMEVQLVNDGPVTILLDSEKKF